MRQGDDYYFLAVRRIDDAVRKSAQSAAPDFFSQSMPRIGEALDSFDRSDGLQQKCIAKAGCLAVVVRDRIVELVPGNLEETDDHFSRYLASASCRETAL